MRALIVGLVLGGLLLAVQTPARGQGTVYLQTFDGSPQAPLAYAPPGWDVVRHNRDDPRHLPATVADHGPDCGSPPATHPITLPEGASHVFLCRDHLMTALNAPSYGVIYLTPPVLVDLGQGDAVIRWDMSTLRTSARDWIDLWVTPWDDQLVVPLEPSLPDLNGMPRNAIHVRMDGPALHAAVVTDGIPVQLPDVTGAGYDTVLTPSASQRDTFELRLGPTRLQLGLPAYHLWWVDTPLPRPLSWTRGVVQLGHHSYTPQKDCEFTPALLCLPGTWHWDNVQVSPAVPFTIQTAAEVYVDSQQPTLTFGQPAPPDSWVRFAMRGAGQPALSLDGGASWQAVAPQWGTRQPPDQWHAQSFWVPVPPGTQRVQLRGGSGWWGADWVATGGALWTAPGGQPFPTMSPLPATATAIASSPTPLVPPTATATPAPGCAGVGSFLIPGQNLRYTLCGEELGR